MTVSMQANEQPNILIVDDISTNLVILSEMVKATGCIPRPVTNVKQAQTAMKERFRNLYYWISQCLIQMVLNFVPC